MPTTDTGPNNNPYPTTYGGSDSRSHAPVAGDGDRDRDRDRGPPPPPPPPSSRTQPPGRPSTITTGTGTGSHQRSHSHGPRGTDDEGRREHGSSHSEHRVRGRKIVVDDLEVGAAGRSHGTPHASDRDRVYNRDHNRDRDRDRDDPAAAQHRDATHRVRARAISVSSGSSYEYMRSSGESTGTAGGSRKDRDATGAGTGRDRDRDNRSSAPPGPGSSRTMSYASAAAPGSTALPVAKATPATGTSTARPSGPDPTSALHAAAAETRLNDTEKERLANSYPPMAPSRIDPRGQGGGHTRAQVDNPLLNAASNTPGHFPGGFTHDVPHPPPPPGLAQSQQPRAPHQQQQQPPQQGETQQPSSTPEKGLFRSMIPASVWSGGGGGSSASSPARDKHKEELLRLQSDASHYHGEAKRLDRELRLARRTCHDLEHERNRLQDNARALHHELANVQHALSEAQALSEVRGRELVGAQVFLTKADGLAISDVVEKVGVLNEEIFQVAAVFAEGLVVASREQKHEQDEVQVTRAYEETAQTIGGVLAGILHAQAEAPEPEVHPLIAQVVLSCFLVQFCIAKLGAWYPSDPNIDQFLGTVYSQIRQNEEQAVFGRWRALLRAQIRPSTDTWKAELITALQKMLTFAGWDAPSEVKRAFAAKLTPIISALEDLRGAMYEKYTSADLEVFGVEAGGHFQSWMEDAYGDERKGQGQAGKEAQVVAGTTGVGLKKLRTTAGASRGHRAAGVDAYESVLSPKVCLESTLREALEPPPPNTKGRKRRAPPQDEGGR